MSRFNSGSMAISSGNRAAGRCAYSVYAIPIFSRSLSYYLYTEAADMSDTNAELTPEQIETIRRVVAEELESAITRRLAQIQEGNETLQ